MASSMLLLASSSVSMLSVNDEPRSLYCNPSGKLSNLSCSESLIESTLSLNSSSRAMISFISLRTVLFIVNYIRCGGSSCVERWVRFANIIGALH